MTVAVTGASGHLGAVLVRELLARGRAVRALYNSDRRALDGLACETMKADICDPRAMREALAGVTVLYHFAAQVSIWGDPTGAVRRINVDGVRTVMDAALAAGVKRVVHCSSLHAYDAMNAGPTLDERTPRIAGPPYPAYNRSKADGERAVLAAIERGLDAVIVNPTGVIGPLDFKPGRMGQFFLALARRELPALVAGGGDWVDVRDVATAALAAEERGARGQNYLLGAHWATIGEVARMAAEHTGVRAPRFETPMALAQIGAPFAEVYARLVRKEPLYTRESLLSLRHSPRVAHDRAARDLGFTPRPLAETIADIHAWFRERGELPARS